jgi:hypothetical protein
MLVLAHCLVASVKCGVTIFGPSICRSDNIYVQKREKYLYYISGGKEIVLDH